MNDNIKFYQKIKFKNIFITLITMFIIFIVSYTTRPRKYVCDCLIVPRNELLIF